MNHLRVQVVKTTRTDLICIACGNFGGGVPMLAIVGPEQPSDGAHAGVHRACIHKVKARRAQASGSKPRAIACPLCRVRLAPLGAGEHCDSCGRRGRPLPSGEA